MRVALVTCRPLPEPDRDEALLLEALRARDIAAEVVAWNDAPQPETFDLWVPRSTWDYHVQLDRFLGWAAHVAARSRLLNPLHLLRWNAQKTYLRELRERGVPVVRTSFVRCGSDEPLREICRFHGWDDVVVKPVVSAGSAGTRRFRPDALADGEAFLRDETSRRDMMVQAYMPDVELGGERSLVYIDGELTHSMRKHPRLDGQDEHVTGPLPIADDERATAEMALRPFRERLLYARVDMVRDASGLPVIMELELIEPSLFLAQHPPALERMADAVARAARKRP